MTFERFIAGLTGVHPSGNGVTARCRAHDDRQASLSVTRGTDGILIHCHAGCTPQQIAKSMGLTLADLFYQPRNENGYHAVSNGNGRASSGHSLAALTLGEFAKAKGFDPQFLSDIGVSEEKGVVVIRYLTMGGQRAPRQRIRLSLTGEKRFAWSGTDGRPCPYLLWLIEDALKRGLIDLYLVEGETDALTLRVYGHAVLGIPGASLCSVLMAPHIRGFRRILIVRENDPGGEVFEKGCVGRLAELEFTGEVRVVEMERANAKDPNELHLRHLGELGAFESEFDALVELSRPVELPRVGILLTKLDRVVPTRVEWFWKNRFPIANTSLLAGMPGVGKTTLTQYAAACASTGRKFADGAQGYGPADVLIITGEDNIASVIVPRLRALGADMSRIVALKTVACATQSGEIDQRGFNLSADIPELKKTLTRNPAIKLVIIDPLSSFLGRADAHKEAEMRGMVMTPLFTLAEEHNVAILIVVHLNKGSGSPLQRISGSVGIAGAARMVWACVSDPEKPDRTLMLPVKLNLARDAGGLAYRIVGSPSDPEIATIVWEDGPIYQRLDEVFAEEAEHRRDMNGGKKLEVAKNLLREMLAEGPCLYSEIEERARDAGVSEMTLRRARWELGVRMTRTGFAKGFSASLSEHTPC